MLRTMVAILAMLWLLGFIGSVPGGVAHLLLVAAAIVLLCDAVARRRAV